MLHVRRAHCACLPLVAIRAAALLLLLAPIGCSLISGPATGTVSGRVSYRGKPVSPGTVLIHTGDGGVRSAILDHDGRYQIADVPRGPVRVAVVAHPDIPPGYYVEQQTTLAPRATRPPVPKQTHTPIPDRYGKPEQSGLTLDVYGGEQTYDIEVTP